MNDEALKEQIEQAIKDGLSNHTGEFLNPWILKKIYNHKELADMLRDILASDRLSKNIMKLVKEHRKRAVREAGVLIDEDKFDKLSTMQLEALAGYHYKSLTKVQDMLKKPTQAKEKQ